jgi:hypothetical protein
MVKSNVRVPTGDELPNGFDAEDPVFKHRRDGSGVQIALVKLQKIAIISSILLGMENIIELNY